MSLLGFDQMPDPASAERDLARVLTQTFSFPPAAWDSYVQQVGRDNFRMRFDEGGRLQGGLAVYRPRQWFGGRALPMGAIAAVGVKPELRGGGVAFALMSEIVREMRATGTPLSALYASTSRLYRKVGYEHAGSSTVFEISTQHLGAVRAGEPLHAIDPGDHARMRPLHDAEARETNGLLERPPGMWTRVSRKRDGDVFAYLTGPESDPTGYVLYEQSEDDQDRLCLRVRDWVARTPGSRSAMLRLFAGHRSLKGLLRWRGPALDPWLMLLPEQETKALAIERWLLRINDVAGALEGRGYPPDLEEALELEVTDEIVPENNGAFRVEVSGGTSRVTRGGAGPGIRLSVRALAPLYSSFHRAEELAALGWIEGDRAQLRAASRIFAGPEPWMSDGF
jgi:predicted acetyltransferase